MARAEIQINPILEANHTSAPPPPPSHLLTSYWPERVTWWSLESKSEAMVSYTSGRVSREG